MSYKVPFVNFAAQYKQHESEYIKAIHDVIDRGDLILRKDLQEFEKSIALYLGVKHFIGVASGTDALILSMKAIGIKPGDEVITCSYTFRATIEAILHVGAVPILADTDEDWRKYKTAKTKLIIPAHLEGKVINWIPDVDVDMIEDSCQAIGAKPLTGKTAAYSFYPAKILGCLGDGGGIATNDKDIADMLYRLRNHDKDGWTLVAYNSRLDNIQASFLTVKLHYLPQILTRRLEIANIYNSDLSIPTPPSRSIYQDYIIEVSDRDALAIYLEDNGIQTMKNGYPFPQGVEKKTMARLYEEHSLRLPCNETLTDEQVGYVVEKINKFYV